MTRYLAWLPVVLTAPGVCAAQNVALNKNYELTATPNYSLTTDSGDATQLTDGQASGGTYHANPGTVGWQLSGPALSVTIDLETVELIEGFSFGTTGGHSGIAFPTFIDTWVSDDGVNYTYGGELVSASGSLGLPPEGDLLRGLPQANRHVFAAQDLRLQGRYVKFTTHQSGAYLFADEVEVFRGSFNPAEVTVSPIALSSGFEQWAVDHKDENIKKIRMLYDLRELEKHAQAGAFDTQIDNLHNQVLALPRLESAPINYTAGLPYNSPGSLHEEIWEVNGQMNRASGQSEHAIAAADAYAPLHPFDTVTATGEQQELHLISGEQRSTAINVSNNADGSRTAEVELSFIGDAPPPGAFELRTTRFTESQRRAIIGSALVEATQIAPNRWSIELPAGATSQLWLTMDGAGLEHFPGGYAGRIRVTPAGGATQELPLHVEVHRGRLTQDHTLNTYAWDYLSENSPQPASNTNRTQLQGLLGEHQIRSHWITGFDVGSQARSTPRNADGSFAGQPQFTILNQWLDELTAQPHDVDRYYVFLGVGQILDPTFFTGGIQPDDPAYGNAVESFFSALASQIDARGLDRSKFAFMPLDEPGGDSPLNDQAIEFVNLMKQAVPQFKVATTAVYRAIDDVDRDLMGATDIIIAHMPQLRTAQGREVLDYYRELAARDGKEFGAYEVTSGGSTRSPATHYRRLAWEAADLGMTHAGMWVAVRGDRDNTFGHFNGEENYEMVFAQSDSPEVTPSKHLAAWRDGAQDYGYTRLAETLAGEVRDAGLSPSLALWTKQEVRRIIDDALADVPDDVYWKPGEANAALDEARLRLLDTIDQVARVAPKELTRLDDAFDQASTALDPAEWTLYQPNVAGPAGVTKVDPDAGQLEARGGEVALTADDYDLTRDEVTLTALMVGHGAGDGMAAHLYNADRSERLEVLINEVGPAGSRVQIRRRDGAVVAETFTDTVISHRFSHSPALLAVNATDRHLEVSLVRRDEQRFSDFETSTYTAGQSINGVDGWATYSGPSGTITADTALGGGQSLALGGSAGRAFDAGTVLTDGTVISYRVRVAENGQAGLYLSDSLATGGTPGGVEFRDGKVQAFSPGGTETGIWYSDLTEYVVSMVLNFTDDEFEVFIEEPDGLLMESLGSFDFYKDLDMETVLAEGGLFLAATGGTSWFDDITVLSPIDGSPVTLLYSGEHNLGGDLTSARFGLANQLGTAEGVARWDEVLITTDVPEPASVMLLGLSSFVLLTRRAAIAS